ncbi:mitochondrial carrier domain-containing protein [Dissophora ornata]|nr:mitochondrial carrier domain-containing protein [Dissophora ornata]
MSTAKPAAAPAGATAADHSSSLPHSSIPDPNPIVNIEADSDPTFLPAEETDQPTTHTDHKDSSSPSSSSSFSSQKQHSGLNKHEKKQDNNKEQQGARFRAGNPPHYETREERQNRIRKQFNQLDHQRSGFLDANSLVGFFAEVTPDKKVQERYADELLQLCHSRNLGRHDSSSSGMFVEEKEERLWNLFREIDHNNDNEIQPEELQASLAKAGINLSDADLSRFIKAMDKDGDGMIDYEEWRDFLVLLPRETTLKEIFHYVQEVVAQVGVDGDVVMPPSNNDYVARYLLAGAIAGAVSRTATAPLDRLKVYLITNSVPALTGSAAQAGLKHIPKFSSPNPNAVAPVKQRLLWTAITELYHQGGLKTFFRGNGLNIIKIAPESAIKFYTYETSKSFIVSHVPSLTVQPHHHHHHHEGSATNGAKAHAVSTHPPDIATSGRFLAGGIAGLVSQFSIYPLETIKTRIMASTGRGKQGGATATVSLPVSSTTGSASSLLSTVSQAQAVAEAAISRKPCIRSVAREMWQRAGLRGFYRGLGPSLVGIFPYAAIDLSVFETLKFGYMRWKAGVHEGDEGSEEKSLERPSVFVLLACGTISGSVGATSVYPLSLVRTRLQAQGTPQHPQTYTSTLDVFRKTFEQEGVRGFYKGMVPTLTKVVPAVSISYVVYEYSKRELGL